MLQERNHFEENINEKLNEHLQKLEGLRDRHLQTVQHRIQSMNIAQKTKQRRAEEREREIQGLFDEYIKWIEETMTTEKQAYTKVVAVLQGTQESM
ncbi:MAG: hypothetical protein ACQES8_04355 [Thermodesulfobacteriota bacterium]